MITSDLRASSGGSAVNARLRLAQSGLAASATFRSAGSTLAIHPGTSTTAGPRVRRLLTARRPQRESLHLAPDRLDDRDASRVDDAHLVLSGEEGRDPDVPDGRPADDAARAELALTDPLLQGEALASGLALDGGVRYWIVKLIYVEIGIALSMALTVFWETSVVASLANNQDPRLPFLGAAMRANAVTFAILFGGAAIAIMPARLRAPDLMVLLVDLLRLA